ncbi:glycosyl hydrolase 53 family protein [Nonomuraea jabiensis]|uniref:glycosyl hydrolase 53 family protein n=1 Tax=Nonomuraea jabiensis TaxID=882448 RepID=UPI003D7454BA
MAKRVMLRMKAQGTTPAFVSLGNETAGGLLFPYGASYGQPDAFAKLARFYKAGPVPYGETPEGQRDFLYELFAGLKTVKDGAVIGDLYWDPVMIPADGVGWQVGSDNVVSNTTLFDFGGKALPALQAYADN